MSNFIKIEGIINRDEKYFSIVNKNHIINICLPSESTKNRNPNTNSVVWMADESYVESELTIEQWESKLIN